MEDLEGKIGQILSDPQAMADIFSMVQNMGFAPPSQEPQSAPKSELPLPLLQAMAGGLQGNTKEQALFEALRPFLRPERQAKLDKAMKLGQMSKLATAALKNMDI